MTRASILYLAQRVAKAEAEYRRARVSRVRGATEKARRKWHLAVARYAAATPAQKAAA